MLQSDIQKFTAVMNRKDNENDHQIQPLNNNISHINPVCTFTTCTSYMHCQYYLPTYTSKFAVVSFHQYFGPEFDVISFSPLPTTCPSTLYEG
jgi:hypothetical protein